ncbi:MAG: hypothetical protein KME20_07710 [Kaiparowitsia implicata GSE-PSE-MK54-09C]|jgi:hypothetical protein|nr:hypothetical protein [Kaiparowitsia implicata GSE-PSE-MK54-09C]
MISQVYYLVRSRQDGQYLVARPRPPASASESEPTAFLLLFNEHADALSYLNTHAAQVSDEFVVESMAATQLKGMLKRWGFGGVGVVNDPLIPQVEFLTIANS